MPSNTFVSNSETTCHSMEDLIHDTPYIDLEVTLPNLFQDAWKVVHAVFPSWDQNELKFVQCKDGITNQLVRVTGPKESVLVRAYGKGSERLIDRKQEMINFITLSRQDLAPPLYGRFRNGLIYGFIQGRVSHVEDLCHPKMAEWIAKRLAQWHKVELLCLKKDPMLWKTMYGWLDQVPEKYDDPKTQETFRSHFNMKQMKTELTTLIQHIEKLNSPIVFCHNDLLYGNIIFNDDKEEAYFIDYEYGCYAYRGFDIGNHFNEYGGFECDYSKYPNKTFQLKWLTWYLNATDGELPTKDKVNKLYIEVDGFSLASHLYWTLWAMIQAMVSDIEFDYMQYAILRFDEYKRRKDKVFATL